MSKPKKRDRAYYLKRLENEHPRIHAEFLAGKHHSVRAAALAAGLIHLPPAVVVLMRQWKRTSAKDRKEFLKRVSGPKPAGPTLASLVDEEGFLTVEAVEEIDGIMNARRMKDADLMEELGFSRHDPSWGMAKPGRRRRKLKKEYLDKLERFLRDHRS